MADRMTVSVPEVSGAIGIYLDSVEKAVAAIREALGENNFLTARDMAAMAAANMENVEWWASKMANDTLRFG